jgi:hypothetical protein
MVLDYLVVGFVVLASFLAAMMITRAIIIFLLMLVPMPVKRFFFDIYESIARAYRRFLLKIERKAQS